MRLKTKAKHSQIVTTPTTATTINIEYKIKMLMKWQCNHKLRNEENCIAHLFSICIVADAFIQFIYFAFDGINLVSV